MADHHAPPEVVGSSRVRALASLRQRCRGLLRQRPFPVAVGAIAVVVGLGVSLASFALQSQFTATFQSGQRLSGWQNFLRLGAPWQALVPVGLAGLLATWGAIRMRSAQPEPPLSLRPGQAASAGRLRAALRSERRAVGAAFMMMSALVVVVLIRVLVYAVLALSGSRLAGATLSGVALELGFWAAAWLAFWNWNRCYRSRLAGWGVGDR